MNAISVGIVPNSVTSTVLKKDTSSFNEGILQVFPEVIAIISPPNLNL